MRSLSPSIQAQVSNAIGRHPIDCTTSPMRQHDRLQHFPQIRDENDCLPVPGAAQEVLNLRLVHEISPGGWSCRAGTGRKD